MTFPDVNLVGVIAAAVANYALGAGWYAGLANPWLEAIGRTREELGSGTAGYIASALGAVVSAWVLAWVVAWAAASSIVEGALVGAAVAVGFVLTSSAAHQFFEERPLNLYWINNGYHLVGFVLMGGILVYFS